MTTANPPLLPLAPSDDETPRHHVRLAADCARLLEAEGVAARVAFGVIPADAPAAVPSWLGPAERLAFERLSLPKRRREWLAGRRAAKRAVALLDRGEAVADAAVEVVALASGAPRVLIDGLPSSLRVSIAHADALAGAIGWRGAEDRAGQPAVGFDLEPLLAPSRFLEEVAFTPEESRWSRGDASGTVRALCLWTAKEAVLKAAEVGLRADLRRVEVTPAAVGHRWQVQLEGRPFHVRHVLSRGYVLAIAVRRGVQR